MCLSIAGKLLSVDGANGVVELGGVKRTVGLQLVPEAQPGNYVLLHAGFAIQIVDEEEAKTTMALIEEFLTPGEDL
jgi:hydrogenase expression/formation protein HypC